MKCSLTSDHNLNKQEILLKLYSYANSFHSIFLSTLYHRNLQFTMHVNLSLVHISLATTYTLPNSYRQVLDLLDVKRTTCRKTNVNIDEIGMNYLEFVSRRVKE